MKTNYDRITKARKVLELPESATLKQIRENYRRLIKEWHPDKNIIHTNIDELRTKETRTNEILRAYKTISAYCSNYRYSFEQGEVEKYMTGQERWFRQFGSDPIWIYDREPQNNAGEN
ncbi:MAG: J domain-containing protein [Desulfobacteraceae bacterium]|nr:MAG: J domain-containing protein [Desulfobacteraceae bacterium]